MKTTHSNYKQHEAELTELLTLSVQSKEKQTELYPRIFELTRSIDDFVDGFEYSLGL